MKEILIINLTRMGDLLQTTPLMAALKESTPDLRLTLVVNFAFAGICRGIPFIDELIVFDMRGFKSRLLQKRRSLVENFRCIEELISNINKKEYDLAINLTHSPVSAILISLVKAKEIRGFTVDSEGHRVIKHPWMRYFFNVVPNRDYNPFHLVDMYLKIGGVMPKKGGLFFEVSTDDEKKADALLRKEGVVDNDLLIGFQPGASKSDRRWPISSFAALADLVSEAFGAKILLFGSADEADQTKGFKTFTDINLINFIGKTSLGELSALLKRCTLFVSNDTGPLHLATAVGTKVIGIFLVNAHFMETGPYGENHYVIEPDLPCAPCGFNLQCKKMVCTDIIKPHAVFEVVREALNEKSALSVSDSPLWNDVQVYKSYFKEDGFSGFYPRIRRSLNKETFYLLLYRELWNLALDETLMPIVVSTGEHENLISPESSQPPFIISSFYSLTGIHELITSLHKDVDALHRLVRLGEEGLNLISLIVEEARKDRIAAQKIKKIWNGIEPIDTEIEHLGYANPFLRPIILNFTYAKEAMEGNELRILAEASCRIYKELVIYSSNLLQYVKKLIPSLESMSDTEESYRHKEP